MSIMQLTEDTCQQLDTKKYVFCHNLFLWMPFLLIVGSFGTEFNIIGYLIWIFFSYFLIRPLKKLEKPWRLNKWNSSDSFVYINRNLFYFFFWLSVCMCFLSILMYYPNKVYSKLCVRVRSEDYPYSSEIYLYVSQAGGNTKAVVQATIRRINTLYNSHMYKKQQKKQIFKYWYLKLFLLVRLLAYPLYATLVGTIIVILYKNKPLQSILQD